MDKKNDEEGMFKLTGEYKAKPAGLISEPPNIKGKDDHGVKKKLVFFFISEKDREEVRNFFSSGKSRIPSGKKLLSFVREWKKRERKRMEKIT